MYRCRDLISDPNNIDYSAASTSMNTIKELLPELALGKMLKLLLSYLMNQKLNFKIFLKYWSHFLKKLCYITEGQMLASTKDPAARKALVEDLGALCEDTRKLCSLTSTEDHEVTQLYDVIKGKNNGSPCYEMLWIRLLSKTIHLMIIVYV